MHQNKCFGKKKKDLFVKAELLSAVWWNSKGGAGECQTSICSSQRHLQQILVPLRGTACGTAQPTVLMGSGNFHHSQVKVYVDKKKFKCSEKESGGNVAAKKQSLW